MKRCNCHPPKPAKPIPGPVQHTGSSLYPDVGPRPLPPCPPMHPRPPVPVPEPWVIDTSLKDIEVVGVGEIRVSRTEDFLTRTYEIGVDLSKKADKTYVDAELAKKADKINILPGDHIAVQRETTDDGTDFTIDAVQFPVKIDGDSDDILYGDGTPNNPLGVYDFAGATEQDDGKPGAVPAPTKDERNLYLKGDGTWSSVDIPEQVQSDWSETSTVSPAYVRNKPDIAAMIGEETERAKDAESELSEAIIAEKSRAETAEESLGQSVSALETRATDLETRTTVLGGDVDKLEEDLSDLSEHVDTELAKTEDKSNKVSSWQSVPDDTHYPTEKLVFDTISDIGKPLVWKGPKTVAELNDPSSIIGLKTGWTYTLTDRGALNDGTVNVEPGDEVAWTEDANWFKVGSEGVVVFKATNESGIWTWPVAEDVVAALSSGTFVVLRTADDTVRYYTFTEAGEGSWVFTSGSDSVIELNEFDGTYSWTKPRDAIVAGDGISVDTGSTGTTVTNTDHVYKETVEGTLDGTVYTVNVPDDTYALVEVPLAATELVVNVGETGDGTTVSESYFQFTLADGSVLDDILVKQNGVECPLMGPMSYPSKVTYQGRVVNGIAMIIGYSPVFYNKEWIGAGNGVLLTAGNGVKFAFHNKEV